MNEMKSYSITFEEAETIDHSLRQLMRHLTTGQNDPAMELPLAQLKVCSALCKGSLSMSALGRELGVSLSAMTQIADRLERARLVHRVNQGADRRVRLLQLTESGEKMMKHHQAIRIGRISMVLECLPPKKRTEVCAALQMLIQAAASTNGSDGECPSHDPQFSNSTVFL
jgi:DNA-binding MarR family transcriptional regulator